MQVKCKNCGNENAYIKKNKKGREYFTCPTHNKETGYMRGCGLELKSAIIGDMKGLESIMNFYDDIDVHIEDNKGTINIKSNIDNKIDKQQNNKNINIKNKDDIDGWF